jgi:hypothetical protein
MADLSLEAKHLLKLMIAKGGRLSETELKNKKKFAAMTELKAAGLVEPGGPDHLRVSHAGYNPTLTRY